MQTYSLPRLPWPEIGKLVLNEKKAVAYFKIPNLDELKVTSKKSSKKTCAETPINTTKAKRHS